MTAKIEALRAPRQVSPWIVIGAAAALIAGLAVLTVQETEVAPTRAPAVQAVRTSEAVEMAELKGAVAHRYMVERFGIGGSSPAVNEQALEAAMKARLAHGSLQPRFGTGESSPAVNERALEAAIKARLAGGYLGVESASEASGRASGREGTAALERANEVRLEKGWFRRA